MNLYWVVTLWSLKEKLKKKERVGSMCINVRACVNDNEWEWNLENEWDKITERGRLKLIRSHKPFRELIFAFPARVQPTQQTKHGNEVTQGLKHQNSGFSCYSSKRSHWLWFTVSSYRACEKLWPPQTFSPQRYTGEGLFPLCCKKNPTRGVLACTTE